ncbi:hypothetical protein F0562_024305 [Nyssa sinensis]|uniref:Reverse transcriptase RNase H-like domain-containing protein n=1 Tax=Nyssa sinensis TaxID=561372 RepID=A0A5J5BDW6_9ASTE|nr:hypothetical protein F0562_024305 [Nyssa sinensis]
MLSNRESSNHHHADREGFSRTDRDDSEKGRQLFSSKMTKLEFPRFTGDGLTEWFNRVAQFFKYQDTAKNQKVSLASFHFEREANQRCGSTHNFISACVASLLQLPVIPTKTFTVRVANDERRYCQGRFEKEPTQLPPVKEVDHWIPLKEGTEPVNVRPNRSWSTYAKEMLAVVEAVRTWRPYLLGRRFFIQTDQRSLKYFLEQPVATPEQQKWVAKLLGYDYEIVYRPGRENSVADALSRKPCSPILNNIFVP